MEEKIKDFLSSIGFYPLSFYPLSKENWKVFTINHINQNSKTKNQTSHKFCR